MKARTVSNDLILSVAGIDDDAIALRLASVRLRLPSLLPTKCMDAVNGLRTGKREQLVWSEAAITALGQSSRELCEQQDELNRLHSSFVREARLHEQHMRVGSLGSWPAHGEVCALLSSLAWARLQGLRSVLLAQLEREADLRSGRPISSDVKLPDGGDGGGRGDPELELVPIEPKDPEDGGKGGGDSGGGSGGAAPAVVVVPQDSAGTGAEVDDDGDDDDGLDFLDRDRKS